MSLSDGIALWLLCLLVLAGVAVVIEPRITRTLDSWLDRRKARKRAAIEADLNRTQAELRRTILQLASAMNGDAHEARKALIRESFLTSGKLPEE